MRKALLALTIALLAFQAGGIYADDVGLVRAINLLKSGEKSHAYRLLESLYKSTSEMNGKSRISLMLALGEQKYLTAPRHAYAEYTLRNYRNLESSMALRLTRIVGDGRFEKSDLEGAKRSYQFILASPNSSTTEKEYATYKLGWIYLNENGAQRAFRLWQNWLEQDIAGDLRSEIMHDCGRAWAEATLHGKTTSLRLRFSTADLERSFYSGVLDAAKSMDIAKNLNLIFTALTSNRDYAGFLAYVSQSEEEFLVRQPCKSAEWLGHAESATVSAAHVQKILNACNRRILEKKEANSAAKLKLLGRIYAQYPGLAASNSTRAAALFSVGDYEKACIEYTNSAIEFVRKGQQLQKLPEILGRTQLTCIKMDIESSAPLLQAVRELVATILSSQAVEVESRKNPQAYFHGILALLKLKGMRDVALSQIVQTQKIWRKSPLPALFIKSLDHDLQSQEQVLVAYLKGGYEDSLAQAFQLVLDQLLEEKRIEEARVLLASNIPVDSLVKLSSADLWLRYLLAADRRGEKSNPYRAVVAKTISLAKSNRTYGKDRQETLTRLVRVLLQNREEALIAANLDLFELALLSDAQSLRQFLVPAIFDAKVNAQLRGQKKSDLVDYIAAAREILEGEAGHSKNVGNRLARTKGALARTGIHSDFVLMEALQTRFLLLKATSGRSGFVPSAIAGSAVDFLQEKLAQSRKRKWASELAKAAAEEKLRTIVVFLANSLEAMPKDSSVQGRRAGELARDLRKLRVE